MYADRDRRGGFHPGSMTMAVALSGVMIAGLLTAAPNVIGAAPDDALTTTAIPLDPPPPTDPVPPQPRTQARKVIETPPVDRTLALVPSQPTDFGLPPTPPMEFGATDGVVGGSGAVSYDPPKPIPAPVVLGPQIDPRFARDIQPAYPAGERRAGNEGRVVVRVLVGTDGRVKQVERVSATADAFWRATQERALARWRFTPGTRDGVPVEAWRTMSLRFVIED